MESYSLGLEGSYSPDLDYPMFTPQVLDPAMYADLSPSDAVSHSPELPGQDIATADMEHHHLGPGDNDLPPAEYYYPGPGDDGLQPADVPDTHLPPAPANPPPPPRRRARYKCVFHIAGCPFSSSRKNDWIRHVPMVHLNQSHYWIWAACPRGSGTENIFMRKDIYIQHLRLRHHMPPPRAPPLAPDERRALADAAFRRRYTLPEAMGCPAAGCGAEFHGERAWSERMHYVAGHLEAAAALGEEDPVGQVDWEVLEWASGDDVGIVDVRRRGGGRLRLGSMWRSDGSRHRYLGITWPRGMAKD